MSKRFNKLILLVVLSSFFYFLFFIFQSCLWQFLVKDGQLVNLVLKENFFATQGKSLFVEVVKDQNSIQKGLSNRTQLETLDGQQLDGMLFIFPKAEIRHFWMKDMLFDIDICWFKEQSFLDCARQASKANADSDEDLLIYQSPQEVNLVLETMPDFLLEDLLGSKLYWRLF